MLLIYGSIIILKIKLVIAFKIWIGNSIQSCQIGVLVQSIHSCGTLLRDERRPYFLSTDVDRRIKKKKVST